VRKVSEGRSLNCDTVKSHGLTSSHMLNRSPVSRSNHFRTAAPSHRGQLSPVVWLVMDRLQQTEVVRETLRG